MSRKKDHIERARQLIGDNAIEIPFGAIDSELCGWEYTIPEGMEAVVKDGKVIVRRTESEDECTRKELIHFLLYKAGQLLDEETEHKFVAYLEKQREQKPAEWNDADMNEARKALISLCRDWERGEKTTLLPVAAIRAKYFLEHLIELQQPAKWSEEDETALNNIIWAIHMKSLSPIDGMDVRDKYNKYEVFLKSLPERFTPHWKPSEEQMDVLKEAVFYFSNSWVSHKQEVLQSLYNDLKKL